VNIPQINIRYGKLIDPFFKDSVLVNYPEYSFPPVEEVKEEVIIFRKAFEQNKGVFFDALDNLGLEFKRNVIDCFIVTATPRDMSAPLIIRSRYSETEFLDAIYHELLHVLFTDNDIPKYNESKNISSTAVNHIDIFAILTYLYLDIINNKERLERVRNISNTSENTDYKKAWDIVDKIGYKNIINDFKNIKKSLPDGLVSSL
jgi:hypothetical protein